MTPRLPIETAEQVIRAHVGVLENHVRSAVGVGGAEADHFVINEQLIPVQVFDLLAAVSMFGAILADHLAECHHQHADHQGPGDDDTGPEPLGLDHE